MKKFFLYIFLFLPFLAISQERNWTLNGYVKELFMFYSPNESIPRLGTDKLTTNTIHNRLNFRWYTTKKLTVAIEMRNRILSGNLIKEFPDYQSMLETDNGYVDLSFSPIDGDNWFFHTMIDRLYLDWTSGNWQIRAGRQRINWGINTVWNPNDIFNSFSYFDFDYEERPGSDALRVQYYLGMTSSAEIVYKLGENTDEMALAGLLRFSKWNYDFQFIGGWVGPDLVIGAGWAGDIEGGGFRGEVSHFIPRESGSKSETATVASITGDYTFSNSIYIQFSTLFNSHGQTGQITGLNPLGNEILSAKTLSFAKYSLFGQVSYPVNPLINGSLSGIINPCDGSFYLGPTISYSLQNNLELMLTSQLFFGEDNTEYGDIGQLFFGRLKWSF